MREGLEGAFSAVWAAIGPFLMFIVLGAIYLIGMSVLTLFDVVRHAVGRPAASAWIPARVTSEAPLVRRAA
jgi:hypothetical protein